MKRVGVFLCVALLAPSLGACSTAVKHAREIGQRWGRRQVEGLLNAGAPCIHFYVMNDASSVVETVKDLI